MSKGKNHNGRKDAYHSDSKPAGQNTLSMLELVATLLENGTIQM